MVPRIVSYNYINVYNYTCRSEEIPNTTHSTIPPERQSTYLVFESALLLLFASCVHCRSYTVNIRKVVVGSFLRVIQECNKCQGKYVWESQSFIGNIPAGNILTSAAILYAGALLIFEILTCSLITRNSFFRHQSTYLQPAIRSVWERHQDVLLSVFREKGESLVVAGDGRADSPGHSAKYGSYSLIELTCDKVVDFKLVQV